jgi:hypothetical protein
VHQYVEENPDPATARPAETAAGRILVCHCTEPLPRTARNDGKPQELQLKNETKATSDPC